MRWLAVIGLTVLAAAGPEVAAEDLTSSEIVRRAVARQDRQDNSPLARSYTVELVTTKESLDSDGETTETTVSRYRRYPLAGGVFDELIARDGEPLTPKEQAEQAEKKAKFIEEREADRSKAAGGKDSADEDDGVRFNEKLISRYRSELAGEETVRGHGCWVIRFWPREGDLPNEKRMDAALNNSSGRLWIAQADYGLARVEFHLNDAVRFWGGLLGNLRGTDGRVELTRTNEGAWLPLQFNLKLDLRVLVKNIRQKVSIEWDKYEHTPAE